MLTPPTPITRTVKLLSPSPPYRVTLHLDSFSQPDSWGKKFLHLPLASPHRAACFPLFTALTQEEQSGPPRSGSTVHTCHALPGHLFSLLFLPPHLKGTSAFPPESLPHPPQSLHTLPPPPAHMYWGLCHRAYETVLCSSVFTPISLPNVELPKGRSCVLNTQLGGPEKNGRD